jgi:hypothetical protein
LPILADRDISDESWTCERLTTNTTSAKTIYYSAKALQAIRKLLEAGPVP